MKGHGEERCGGSRIITVDFPFPSPNSLYSYFLFKLSFCLMMSLLILNTRMCLFYLPYTDLASTPGNNRNTLSNTP